MIALADQIEARFTQARAQVDKLTPSLLGRAFRGQLVPQEWEFPLRLVAEPDALQAELDAPKCLQAEAAAGMDALLPAILDRAFKGQL